MKGKYIHKIFLCFSFLLFLSAFSIFAVDENEDYIYWYTPDRYDGKLENGEGALDTTVLSHHTLPLGTKVLLSVNGGEKEMIINDRPSDKRATFGTDAITARFLGFYPYLREKVSFKIVSMQANSEENSQRRNTLYKITSIYPKESDDIISLANILIKEGFKTTVDKTGSFVEVSFIPSYNKDSELEFIREFASFSSPMKLIEIQ